MLKKRFVGVGLALWLGGSAASAQTPAQVLPVTPATTGVKVVAQAPQETQAPGKDEGPGSTGPTGATPWLNGAPPEPTETPLGPTPLDKVGILQKLIYDDRADCALFKFSGWMDFDYTYRSSGSGVNNVAPVMNRFGDNFLVRQLGLELIKPLDPKEWSWGFNSILIAGADASFLQPTAGGWANSDPRFGLSFTDLNVTAHAPILTDGGVDIKAGRQTTILGPMGALPWQRYFDSSDYAWYNMEEGRYTGVSGIWHISKQLDWYNGAEIGGWGVFFDDPARGVDYITNISYWLDEDAKKTKVWTTILTGPTGFVTHDKNTTVVELGIQHNWNKYIYQIVDTQMVFSEAPIFGAAPPGYHEHAYDVYTYLGAHLCSTWDLNSRFEWYYDREGGGYPGGFGVPDTNYFEMTFGPDYHPTKWLQVRPEIRYDHASNANFGSAGDLKKDQLSIAVEALFKF